MPRAHQKCNKRATPAGIARVEDATKHTRRECVRVGAPLADDSEALHRYYALYTRRDAARCIGFRRPCENSLGLHHARQSRRVETVTGLVC